MKKYAFFTGLLLILGIPALHAQKYSNEFLAIGVGAKAHGMSGAQTAHVQDITAAYWNPAGLSEITAPFQVAAMHAEWFVGVSQYDYLSFGKSLHREKGSFLAFSPGVAPMTPRPAGAAAPAGPGARARGPAPVRGRAATRGRRRASPAGRRRARRGPSAWPGPVPAPRTG